MNFNKYVLLNVYYKMCLNPSDSACKANVSLVLTEVRLNNLKEVVILFVFLFNREMQKFEHS